MNLSLVLQVETKGRFMKIKRVNVTSQVVDYLKKNIESGNWTVGEKIPSENQMTEELGVSRSSIRTALQYLIGLGVLESVHGKGTYLINSRVENWDETENKITSEDCRDIEKVLEFRKILEPDACRLAVEKRTPEIITALETYLEQMQMFQGNREKFVNADLKFHEVICRSTGNTLLEKSLHKVFQETRQNHEQMNELFGYDSGIHYHAQILKAFKNGNADAAHDIMYEHLDAAMKKL